MADTGPLRPYTALIGSRVRSQTSYRTSFALDVLANAAIGVSELAGVYVIFSNVEALGGLTVWQAALVFAISNLAFALADLAVGHLDTMPTYLRTGTLDAMLLRPAPLLAQVVTSDVSLRRLGRAAVAVAVIAVAVPRAGIEWGPATITLLVSAPLSGAVVFGALFVVAGAAQFWLVEGRELTNSFTYGGQEASSYPASIYATPLRLVLTYVVPATVVAYLPVLALLGVDGPFGTPSWLGWMAPVVAAITCAAAGLCWRAAVRHYTGTGS